MIDVTPIKGAKKNKEEARVPNIAKDSVASTSTAKLLYGLAEGAIEGLVDGGKSILLDGTPLLDAQGNPNFANVYYDFRPGTNEQSYISGFPDVSNETPINVELKSANPWVQAFSDTQLSAIRIRFKWNRLSQSNATNGDVTGYRIDYAIDLQTDGGGYQTVLNTSIQDKTSGGYERTHRIDLPRATTGWQIRVRRITPNSTSDLIQDTMLIDAVTEVIDVKLRYPNTALLGLRYDAQTFGKIAKLEVHLRGSIIRVPSNYDAVLRTYTGLWDGTFKDAYSNNPAWVYYDLCTQWRYGLGERLDTSNIDKWSLYALGQYCDQKVSDGEGGLEPRFTVNVYLQKQSTAYEVLANIAGIFRAMSYWNGEKIVLDADVPQDPVYTFSRANVVNGEFNYPGSRLRDRHTIAKVAWDNPNNDFQTEYEFIRDEKAMSKFGAKVLDLSAFGCTSRAQAQRAGLWALKTEQLETRQANFTVGLDGFIPQIGNVINISDELFAGRANGGRISAVSDAQYVVTLDRDVVATSGDVLIVNSGTGVSERRNITKVVGRKITVTSPFTAAESQNIWAIETSDLKLMRFRVMSVAQDEDNGTFGIQAIQHEPQKFDAIDFGADIKPTDITISNPDVVDAPAEVTLSATHRIVQGQTVTTLVIEWSQVKSAVAYDVEWQKDNGTWIKARRTGNVVLEVEGVYSGQYLARVRAVSAFESQSRPTVSVLTDIAGRNGLPPTVVNLVATGVLFGMSLHWGFAEGTGDANYTEIQVASAPDVNVAFLTQVSYPSRTHEITGLQGNLTQHYRARIVDKLGFESPWTPWIVGTTDDSADTLLGALNGQITESQLYQDLGAKINDIGSNKSAIEEQQTTIDGLGAQWTIKADVNGLVGGIGLANDGTVIDLAIRANKFYIAPPSGTDDGTSPFMVLTTATNIDGVSVPPGAYIRSGYIHKASIDSAQIKDAAIKSAQIDDLAVTTGKIASLAVDTLQIAGEAVTVPRLILFPTSSSLIDSSTQSSTSIRFGPTFTVDAKGGNVTIQLMMETVKLEGPADLKITISRKKIEEGVNHPTVFIREISFLNGDASLGDRTLKFIALPIVLDVPPSGLIGYNIDYDVDSVTGAYSKATWTNTSILITGVKR